MKTDEEMKKLESEGSKEEKNEKSRNNEEEKGGAKTIKVEEKENYEKETQEE